MNNETELRDRLNMVMGESTGEKCPWARMVDDFDPETGQFLEDRIQDPSFPYTRLHREIRRVGVKISVASVAAHKNKQCVCRFEDKA